MAKTDKKKSAPAKAKAEKPAAAKGRTEKSTQPYVVIARKWRPSSFDNVVGQEEVTQQLTAMIEEDRLGQAFLFCGPRGVGKTSSARLLAMALNCTDGPSANPPADDPICREIRQGSDLDVIEIDGASNNGVDEIRELRSKVSLAPVRDRFKVYIIDEVHMLSLAAFNALLKTLEEPPPHVKFIFATTERHKIPETILSRCQVFDFNRLDTTVIAERLDHILTQEPSISIEEENRHEILEQIAMSSDGGMRDAQMTLDQLVALGQGIITLENTLRLLGLVESRMLEKVLNDLVKGKTANLLATVAELVKRGRDLERFLRHLLAYLRAILLMRNGAPASVTGLDGERQERAFRHFGETPLETLLNIMQALMDIEPRFKGTIPQRILLEFCFIKLTALQPTSSLASLVDRLELLEKKKVSSPPQANAPQREESSKGDSGGSAETKGATGAGRVMPVQSLSSLTAAPPQEEDAGESESEDDSLRVQEAESVESIDLSRYQESAEALAELWKEAIHRARQERGVGQRLAKLMGQVQPARLERNQLTVLKFSNSPRMVDQMISDARMKEFLERVLRSQTGATIRVALEAKAALLPVEGALVADTKPKASTEMPVESADVIEDTHDMDSAPAMSDDELAHWAQQLASPSEKLNKLLDEDEDLQRAVALICKMTEGRIVQLNDDKL
jgi:DNA polymerase-3 subunit gamma/tau